MYIFAKPQFVPFSINLDLSRNVLFRDLSACDCIKQNFVF